MQFTVAQANDRFRKGQGNIGEPGAAVREKNEQENH